MNKTDLDDVIICHRSICRRTTGAKAIAVVAVVKTAFSWARGKGHIQTWQKPGLDWKLGFCRHCGSPMPGDNDGARKFVPAEPLSKGSDDLKVIHNIWGDSRAGWDVIGDDGQQHPEIFQN